jgi:hypothetical protein
VSSVFVEKQRFTIHVSLVKKTARDDGILLFVLEAYSAVDTLDVEQTPVDHK